MNRIDGGGVKNFFEFGPLFKRFPPRGRLWLQSAFQTETTEEPTASWLEGNLNMDTPFNPGVNLCQLFCGDYNLAPFNPWPCQLNWEIAPLVEVQYPSLKLLTNHGAPA